MDKRGVSEIVATVLIIVIVVAAVGLLWAFVAPLIKDNLSSVDCSMMEISIPSDLEYTCYEPSKLTMVQVAKGSSDLEIGALKFYILSGGNEIRYQKNVNFSSGQKVFYLDTSRFASIEEIKVIPVVGSGRSQKSCGEISLKSLPTCNIKDVPVSEIIPANSVSNSDGTTDVDKLWYYDSDCDGYGSGSSISKAYRPSFAGCINTSQEVVTISTGDFNDNDKFCHSHEVCNARNGLVAYWPMDEDKNDYSTNQRTLTCGTNQCPIEGSGIMNKSFIFDGQNTSTLGDRMSATNVLLNSTNGFTVSVWVRPNNWTTNVLRCSNGIVSSKEGNVWYSPGWSLSQCVYNNLYKAVFWYSNATSGPPTQIGNQTVLVSTKSIMDNNWHHVVITAIDSGNISLYVDGSLDKTVVAFAKVFSSDIKISTTQENPTPYYYNGSVDEVAIFNRSLNATEISAFYNSGSGFKLKD
jgi:flagellin-like protein